MKGGRAKSTKKERLDGNVKLMSHVYRIRKI